MILFFFAHKDFAVTICVEMFFEDGTGENEGYGLFKSDNQIRITIN